MKQDFNAKDYWESRLESRFDLRGVGDIGLSESYNKALYRVRATAFRLALARTPRPLGECDVLDIGSGTGFYVEQWMRQYPRSITGSDLTDVAVRTLGERYTGATFTRCDIGAALPPELDGRTFHCVSAMDMLFHIVDDAAYARAMDNFAALVSPDGVLIFSDNLSDRRIVNGPHQISRSEAEVRRLLTDRGFEVVKIQPMFALMNDPVRSRSKNLKRLFARVYRLAARSERSGAIVGKIVEPLEKLAIRLLKRGPSTEIFVCRRRSGSAA